MASCHVLTFVQARMLSQLSHPFIIRHYESFLTNDDVLHIVMDYAAGGTVYHAVRGNTLKPLSEDRIWKWAVQLLLGIAYIHGKRIIHRDIKSLNLFLDANDSIKIGDFGIARALGDGTDMLRTIIGTCVAHLLAKLHGHVPDKTGSPKQDAVAVR